MTPLYTLLTNDPQQILSNLPFTLKYIQKVATSLISTATPWPQPPSPLSRTREAAPGLPASPGGLFTFSIHSQSEPVKHGLNQVPPLLRPVSATR